MSRPARQRRTPIRVEKLERRGSDFGDGTQRWIELLTCFAEVTPLRGRALEDARQLVENVTHRVRLRWSELAENIAIGFRVLLLKTSGHERLLTVRYAMNVREENEWLELLCVEES